MDQSLTMNLTIHADCNLNLSFYSIGNWFKPNKINLFIYNIYTLRIIYGDVMFWKKYVWRTYTFNRETWIYHDFLINVSKK